MTTKAQFRTMLGNKYTPLIIILASFVIRVGYAVILSDAKSGQDAPSYLISALRILQDGPFADNTSAPFFPIGYPWFVAAIWKIFGVSYEVLGIVQNILLSFSLFAFYEIVRDYFGRKVAIILLLFLSTNLAVTASISLLSYEIPMGSLLILGFYFLYKSRKYPTFSLLFFSNILLSGIFFSIATIFQPKILLSIISIVLIFIFWCSGITNISKKLIVSSIIFSIIAIGPAAAIYRNWDAGDGIGYTKNFSTNIVYGAKVSNAHIDFSKCPQNKYGYDSVSGSLCMLIAKSKTPSQALKSALHQGTYFWTPFVGNLKFMGTWYHGGDWRRLVPAYAYQTNYFWYTFDRIISYLWSISLVFLMLYGFKLSFRKTASRVIPYLFASPVILLWFMSVLTYGEPRYRLPILPFYTLFVVISIEHIFMAFRHRNKSSHVF